MHSASILPFLEIDQERHRQSERPGHIWDIPGLLWIQSGDTPDQFYILDKREHLTVWDQAYVCIWYHLAVLGVEYVLVYVPGLISNHFPRKTFSD